MMGKRRKYVSFVMPYMTPKIEAMQQWDLGYRNSEYKVLHAYSMPIRSISSL